MVLILTQASDEHADLVCSRLTDMRARFVRFHPHNFPQQVSMTLRLEGDSTLAFHAGGDLPEATVSIAEIDSVWYRRPLSPRIDSSFTGQDANFVEAECEHSLSSLYRLLSSKCWLNTPDQITSASSKPHQLALSREFGLLTPRTIVSNDPTECLRFFEECNGAVIYKGLSGYMRPGASGAAYEAIFTTIISKDELLRRQDSIRFAPCLFQEYLPKAYEVRVTIVGSTVLAVKIDSQRSAISAIDWRRYDLKNTPYTPHNLPKEIEGRLLSLMSHYHLSFGCIDMVVSPAGEYFFLELNPNGQWYWVEKLAGLPISQEIASFLATGTKNGLSMLKSSHQGLK